MMTRHEISSREFTSADGPTCGDLSEQLVCERGDVGGHYHDGKTHKHSVMALFCIDKTHNLKTDGERAV